MSLLFLGWADRDSGLQEYRYKVYRMALKGGNKLQEDEKPIISGTLSLFDKETESNFTLPSPGMYSIVGQVVDFASNVRCVPV